jgi:hypothetical protein
MGGPGDERGPADPAFAASRSTIIVAISTPP